MKILQLLEVKERYPNQAGRIKRAGDLGSLQDTPISPTQSLPSDSTNVRLTGTHSLTPEKKMAYNRAALRKYPELKERWDKAVNAYLEIQQNDPDHYLQYEMQTAIRHMALDTLELLLNKYKRSAMARGTELGTLSKEIATPRENPHRRPGTVDTRIRQLELPENKQQADKFKDIVKRLNAYGDSTMCDTPLWWFLVRDFRHDYPSPELDTLRKEYDKLVNRAKKEATNYNFKSLPETWNAIQQSRKDINNFLQRENIDIDWYWQHVLDSYGSRPQFRHTNEHKPF